MFGGGTSILEVDESPMPVDRVLSFYGPFREETGLLRSITLPRRDESGQMCGSYLIATLKLEVAGSATGSLSQ